MMQEIGVIKSVDGVLARVLIGRKSSCCDSCEKDTCDIPEDGVETEAINEAGAAVGQKVKVVMKPLTYFKGALIIYVLPIFALIAGAILGKMYLPSFIGGIDSDLLAALGGSFSFLVSMVLVKILSDMLDRKTENKSVIKEILK